MISHCSRREHRECEGQAREIGKCNTWPATLDLRRLEHFDADILDARKEDQTMNLFPGQQGVWMFQPRINSRRTYLVDAEVVRPGPLRTLIRITTQGRMALRWVKPANLRPKNANEPIYKYPKFG